MSLKRVIKKARDYRDKLDDNLVLWLRFNEGAGTTAYDSSRYFNHGTIDGATYADGKVGEYALSFDGDNDYVEIPHNANQLGANLGDGFTISAWINPRSIGETAGFIFSKTESTVGTNGFLFRTTSNNRLGFLLNGGADILSANDAVLYGVWTHVLVTISSGQLLNYYINGVANGAANQDLIQTIATITTTNAIRIGNRSNSTDRTFDGEIDDIRFYNRVFSASEAAHLYTLVGGS